MLACKNNFTHLKLADMLSRHEIVREYRALVYGVVKEDKGMVDAPIGRSQTDRRKMAVIKDGKPAVTHGKVLERFDGYTYCEFRLETGRTHQIRVHMASKGHPLLGDDLYGPKKCPFALEGQTLHAMIIGFVHPSSGEYMEFSAPLPDYYQK
jgi:23S rRNA pseudouridine1911/1915/1917 synthase